jgi:PAS domain S-box-containing protein
MFGYTAAEAVGRHISLVIPAERLFEEDRIVASLRAGNRIEHFETERRRADGSLFPVSLTISPIVDDEKQVIGASKIARDITRQRQAEAERKQLADSLSKSVAELSEADRRKNEFLAMLAHELRHPLAPISNAARALRIGGADQAALRSASEMLERQVAQMSRLVDDLLDMSRISRGKIELRRKPIELMPAVRQAVEAVGPQFRRMNHELSVTSPKEPVYLEADAARLAQVIGNLLNNAGKFTDQGGHISLSIDQQDGHVIIRVSDDGIGIAAEDQSGLFEMFEQVDTSLERSRDGLGIGLTLVKVLVEMHGGTVEVHSDGPGHGSEFVVRLPTIEEPVVRPSAAPPAIVTSVARRVLIVDDSEDGAESLAMLLQFAGHETHKAHDGATAIRLAERLRPDVVLMDIGLPRMSGYEVCSHIRTLPWGKDLVMIALTGWGQDEDRRRSQEAGFDAHLIKPVDDDVLLKLLTTLPEHGSMKPEPT